MSKTKDFSKEWWAERLPTVQAVGVTQDDYTNQLAGPLREAMDAAGKRNLALTTRGQNEEPIWSPDHTAGRTYRANMPLITCRREAQLYISAVVLGLQLNLISMKDAKTFLYGAQTALAGFSLQRPDPIR